MEARTLARGMDNLAKGVRGEALARIDLAAERYSQMTDFEKAWAFNALDARTREALAARMTFSARDLEQMEARTLARGVDNLDRGSRVQAFERFEMNEAKYRGLDDFQKAGIADIYGARTLGRATLSARAFDQLTPMQKMEVWDELGSRGRHAALRYAGLSRGDLDQLNARQQSEAFERAAQGRSARD